MKFKIVDFNNYKTAINVQKEIFPTEDGTINILASLDRDLFINKSKILYPDDNVKYYLVYDKNVVLGITGLYCEKGYLNDVWLGWFGVLPTYRGKGLGERILLMTINLAKEQGYKNIRLYTDAKENVIAINLYKKMGFIGEKYNVEKLKYDCYVYSKSLTNNQVELWKDRMLNLGYQFELDHMDENKVKQLLSIYEEI